MREIATQAHLPFAREQVWAVLADLRRYRDWNPLNIRADGEAVAGALVPMKFIDPGHPGRILSGRVRMTVVDPPSRLEWVGRVLPPLFTGRPLLHLTARGAEHGAGAWGATLRAAAGAVERRAHGSAAPGL